jgi:cyanate lyase
MNSLARLIQTRKAELDLTYPEIAARGGFSSHTVVFALATKKRHSQLPRPATMRGIARALDVPVGRVFDAAVQAVWETTYKQD